MIGKFKEEIIRKLKVGGEGKMHQKLPPTKIGLKILKNAIFINDAKQE